MIFLRLYGGLGNQIFQFAAAIEFSNSNRLADVAFDTSGMGKYSTPRTFDLDAIFDLSRLEINTSILRSRILHLRVPKVIGRLGCASRFVSDGNFLRTLSNISIGGNYYLDGYFQDCLGPIGYDHVVSVLKPICRQALSPCEATDSAVIHIRGGDFIQLGWNSIAGPSYYRRAIECLESHGVRKFIVITDDRLYAENLIGKIHTSSSIEFGSPSGSMAEDFSVIGSYAFRILSGSTFAFWASSLGNNPVDGVVICPKMWGPKKRRNLAVINELLDFEY